jgi:hypothetical protein
LATFSLLFTPEAEKNLKELEHDRGLIKGLKAVRKALALLETNPRHPGLHTHKYESFSKDFGRDLFGAYAESKTPAAYRIFWHYGPGKNEITIVAITPHP